MRTSSVRGHKQFFWDAPLEQFWYKKMQVNNLVLHFFVEKL